MLVHMRIDAGEEILDFLLPKRTQRTVLREHLNVHPSYAQCVVESLRRAQAQPELLVRDGENRINYII